VNSFPEITERLFIMMMPRARFCKFFCNRKTISPGYPKADFAECSFNVGSENAEDLWQYKQEQNLSEISFHDITIDKNSEQRKELLTWIGSHTCFKLNKTTVFFFLIQHLHH